MDVSLVYTHFLASGCTSVAQCEHLFAIVSDRRQDGAEGFDTHGDVQKMSGKEEVVVMSKERHQHIPNQVQESLKDERGPSVSLYSKCIVFFFK